VASRFPRLARTAANPPKRCISVMRHDAHYCTTMLLVKRYFKALHRSLRASVVYLLFLASSVAFAVC
jgi:hypothetical protein